MVANPAARRRRGCALILAALLVTAAVAPAGARPARSSCRSAPRILAAGRLTIFYSFASTSDDTLDERACLGTGPSMHVGGSFSSPDSEDEDNTEAYAWDGSRHVVARTIYAVAVAGGYRYFVYDLERRTAREVTDDVNPQGLAPDGPPLVTAGGDVLLEHRFAAHDDGRAISLYSTGSRRKPYETLLSTEGAVASQLALIGNTAYWTERGAAHTATLPGPPTRAENQVVAPVSADGFASASPCDRLSGATVAGTVRVRVLRRAGRILVCRAGGPSSVRIPAGAIRIARDRWVLSRGASRLTLVDAQRGRTVRSVRGIRAATMLQDGALAWIDATGRLLLARPAQRTPRVLAPAATAPTALASASATVYWTAGGAPHRFR
jgi:hypothetical protein